MGLVQLDNVKRNNADYAVGEKPGAPGPSTTRQYGDEDGAMSCVNHANQVFKMVPEGIVDSLAAQLAALVATLAAKLSINDVQTQVGFADINKNRSLIDSTMLTPALLQMIAGTAGVNVTPAAGSVLTDMLAALAVVPSKLDRRYAIGIVGKNLFDPLTVTSGKYVNYSTGGLNTNASYTASDYITALPQRWYIPSGYTVQQQLAFYNSSKVYISGIATYNGPFQTPAGTAYIRITVKATDLATFQLELGSISTVYESYRTLPILGSIIPAMLDRAYADGVQSVNLFNKATVKSGKYISYTSGNEATSANYSASDFIAVSELAPYTTSGFTDDQQGAWYTVDKVFISGFASYAGPVTSPAGTAFVRVTAKSDCLNTFQFQAGSVATAYEPFGYLLDMSKIKNYAGDKTVYIDVNPDGSGNLTSFRAAIDNITDSSVSKPYVIRLHEGTCNITDYYTPSEIADTNFNGPMLPDYVSIIGIGDRSKIIIQCILNSSYDSATMSRVSALNVRSVSDLRNITIIGQDTRYALHDDWNTTGLAAVRNIIDCILIKKIGTGGGLPPAYGAGCKSGASYNFEGTQFISERGYAFSLHNNRGFTAPCRHKAKNCRFINTAIGAAGRYAHSIEILSEHSGTADTFELIGCYLSHGINNASHDGTFSGGLNTEGTIDFTITGYGNTIAPNTIYNTDGVQHVIEFCEETERQTAITTISRGTPIKYSSRGYIQAMASGDNALLFAGIAWITVAANVDCVVKKKGYIAGADVGLPSIAIGDKVGIVNGQLSIVTSGDYIGYCKFPGFVYLP